MKILITGDFVINKVYDTLNLKEDVVDLFSHSDLNIVNLEAPITSTSSKIVKTGPHLKAEKESTLRALKRLKIDLVTLANNHILDYDVQGVKDTLNFCAANNIQTTGAGMNLEEASKTLFVDSAEGTIAIVNFAENEWASATIESAGANPMNIIDNLKQIKKAKQKADFVFVIVHGGHEYYNLPSPRMQKQYRFYADQGADIVIGHHTHCISGYEIYQDVPIYYSLGNFLFTKPSSYEDWYIGLILKLEIKNGKLLPKLYPVQQEKDTFELSLLIGKDKDNILQQISDHNKIIENKIELESEWNRFILFKSRSYLNNWSPLSFIPSRYIKAVFHKLGIKFVNKKAMLIYLNYMRCEAHRDISKEVIKNYLKQ